MNEEFDDASAPDNLAPGDSAPDDDSAPKLPGLFDAFPPGRLPPGLGDWALVAESLASHGALALMRLKVEQVDRAVGRAMEQVPLPAGLAERLLASLRQDAVPPSTIQDDLLAEAAVADGTLRLAEGRARVGRRRWLEYGSAAAVLAAAAAWFWVRTAPPEMSYDEVIADVRDFHEQEQPAVGEPLNADAPLGDYPCPSAIETNARTRWRPVSHVLGRAGVAYDLTNKRDQRATLYVVDLKSWSSPIDTTSLQTSPPVGRFTLGRTTGAWTDGRRLYVLVVEGDAGDYRSFLRRQDSFA